MSENSSHFDDPALKSALRRACGRESAPSALRQRVEGVFATATANAAGAGRDVSQPSRWRIVRPSLALAAAVVIAVGAAAMFTGLLPNPFSSPSEKHLTAFTPALAAAMVSTHDRCAKRPDHHGIKSDDFVQIGKTMEAQLNRKVMSMPLATGNWKFNGAAICGVGDNKSGHLLFTHGDQHVSIFSLPAKFEYCSDNYSYDYQTTVEHHPIAGFVRSGCLFCVVGSASNDSLSIGDVVKMRDDLKAKSSSEACHDIVNTVAMMAIDDGD